MGLGFVCGREASTGHRSNFVCSLSFLENAAHRPITVLSGHSPQESLTVPLHRETVNMNNFANKNLHLESLMMHGVRFACRFAIIDLLENHLSSYFYRFTFIVILLNPLRVYNFASPTNVCFPPLLCMPPKYRSRSVTTP